MKLVFRRIFSNLLKKYHCCWRVFDYEKKLSSLRGERKIPYLLQQKTNQWARELGTNLRSFARTDLSGSYNSKSSGMVKIRLSSPTKLLWWEVPTGGHFWDFANLDVLAVVGNEELRIQKNKFLF